jgi:ribose/xylose/arabinose/galactoside ABC-type transport system permease subunit
VSVVEPAAAREEAVPRRRYLPAGYRVTYDLGILAVAGLIFLIFSLTAAHFTDLDNLLNIVRQWSLTGIVAIGLTFVMIAAEIDLSVGSLYALLTGVLAELTVENGWNPWVGALVIILIGIGTGVMHGLITQIFNVPSFIVTLGGLAAYLGIYNLMTGGYTIAGFDAPTFSRITGSYVGRVPVQLFWFAGVAIVAWIVLSFTPFGYNVFAVGGNARAARRVGIRSWLVKTQCFMLLGGLIGLAGALNLGWLHSATPQTGVSLLLDAITAVIIGGTSLFGGAGSIRGTIVGLAILGMISNGLVLLGVSPYWDPVAKGTIIVIAVVMGSLLRGRRVED